MQEDKRGQNWFRKWEACHLTSHPAPHKNAPQNHCGITGFLSEFATHLQNTEALCPVVAVPCKADREMRVWDRLPQTSQRVIISTSAADGITIMSSPPLPLHRFMNSCNTTALQANCALAYSTHNIYLPTAFCQSLFQDLILAIPDPNAPTGLSLNLIHLSSAGPENSQQSTMRVQVLIAIGQDLLSKEEACKLLDQ